MSANSSSTKPGEVRDAEQDRLLTDLTPVMLMRCDADERYVFVNRAYAEHRGQAAAEIIGRTVREITGEENYRIIQPYVRRALAGESVQYEATIHYQALGPRHVSVSYEPERNKEGTVCGWVSAITDVTAMRRSQSRADDMQLRLDAALNFAEVGTWTWDIPKNRVRADRNLARLFFGIEEDIEREGGIEHFIRSIHPDDRRRVEREIQKSLQDTDGVFECDYRITPRSGDVRWVTARGRVQFDRDGRPLQFPGVIIDITQRKRQEEAVQELMGRIDAQARLFDATLSHIADLAYTFDQDARVIYANKPLLDIWGLSLAEAVGKNCFDLGYPTELAERLTGELLSVIQTGQPVQGVTDLTSADGRVDVHEYIYNPVYDPEGRVVAVTGTTRLITERKTMENALRASEEKLSRIMALMPVGVYSCDGEGRLTFYNRRAAELWGHEPLLNSDLVKFCACHKVFLPDGTFVPSDATPMAVALRESRAFRGVESIVERPDGSRFTASVNIDPIHDEEGQVIGAINVFQDITETKAAEIASRRLSAIVEWSDDAIISKDLNGIIMTWNHGAERLFGYTAGEMVGQLIEKLIPENRRREEPDILGRIRQGAPIEHYETIRRHKDGTLIPISLTVSPIRDSSGKIIGASKIARNITEQKRIESELKHSRDEAERANRAKDQFLAVLSHELRTPLTPVLMAVSARQMDPTLPAAIQADLAMIRRNIELETKLIDDLLDLNRIISGKLNLRLESVRVNEVVAHVCEICRSPIREKGIRFQQIQDPSDSCVRVDSARFQQVLWNLLKNAEKFTPENGLITVTTRAIRGRVRVEVSDTGAGIAPEILPRIFNAFEQGDARVTQQFGGLGLGLAICQALMELHGGSICAESAGVGQGSKFSVEMPVEITPEPTPAAESRPVPETADHRLRVLVAEDHPDTALVLSQLMRGWGHDVKVAGSVAEALNILRDHPFDILVSDLGLPDATGYELMRQAREMSPLKGIAMSGYGMEEDIRKSREAGFSEHLVKPVNLAQLEKLIQSLATS